MAGCSFKRKYKSRREAFILMALSTTSDDCIVWPFAIRKSSGYGAHSLYVDGAKINVDAHRHVCERAHGPAPLGKRHAAHRCNNRLCINLHHLRWTTHGDNMQDLIASGEAQGPRGWGRLSKSDRLHIATSDKSILTVAHEFGIGISYAGKIRREAKTKAHLTPRHAIA